MKMTMAVVALCAIGSTQTYAQTAQLGSPAIQPAMQQLVLPPNTEIAVTPNDSLTSKNLREGDTVIISTIFDVMHAGYIVIPKNTPGKAAITWRTGKGVFGKSAKMELTFISLDLGNDKRLALTGKHRQDGQGNTGATIGAVVAVGLIGGLVITGKSATVPHSMQLSARTAEPLAFAIPASAVAIPQALQAIIIDNPTAVPTATILK